MYVDSQIPMNLVFSFVPMSFDSSPRLNANPLNSPMNSYAPSSNTPMMIIPDIHSILFI
jgi:hypothetical protein